jgi:hypothetical protein
MKFSPLAHNKGFVSGFGLFDESKSRPRFLLSNEGKAFFYLHKNFSYVKNLKPTTENI